MTTLSRCRIRLAGDLANQDSLVDALTNESAVVYRGVVAQAEIGLFNDVAIVDSLAGIESLTLEIRPLSNPTAAAYVTKTVLATALTACTQPAWTAGTGQHALINLSEEDTNLPAQGGDLVYHLVLGAVITAGPVTLGTGVLTIREDGIGSTGDANPVYYTPGQSDARYVQRTPAVGGWRMGADGWPEYYFPDNTWRALIPIIVDGQPSHEWSDPR